MTLLQSASSKEYLRVTISALRDGVAVDPTTEGIRLAVVAEGAVPTGFVDAAWETGGPPYTAVVLSGPGTLVDLDAGVYDIWAEVDFTPELAVFKAERLVVFADETPFVSVAELADFLGTAIDPESGRAAILLAIAVGAVRAKTRQTISRVTDDVYLAAGDFSRTLTLPERPIVSVASVEIAPAGGSFVAIPSISYGIVGDGLELAAGCEPDDWGGPGSVVRVTYTHGFARVPDEVRGVVLSIAARLWQNPGVASSESILSYSVSYGDPSKIGLADIEDAILSRFRKRSTSLGTRPR